MQTFLPYPSFRDTAMCLDYRRLGKQRVEAWQILQLVSGQTDNRWKHHPIVRMWTGHERALALYGSYMCTFWKQRGYKDTLQQRFEEFLRKNPIPKDELYMPGWMGSEALHASHRSNLLRKDPKWYSQFGWEEKDNLPYVWL